MPGVWQIPASGGQVEQLAKGAAGIARWSPDGKQIYFVGLRAQANNWQLSLSNRDERPITDLAGKRGNLGGPGLATDGRYIYFTWEDPLGDIWVADIGQGVGR
jgi:Tol biopolymer transport system component